MLKLKMGWSPCCHSSPCPLLLATLRGLRIGAWVLRFAHAHVCTMATCARCTFLALLGHFCCHCKKTANGEDGLAQSLDFRCGAD